MSLVVESTAVAHAANGDETMTSRKRRKRPLGADLLAEYYTEHQLADQFGVTLRTLRTWRAAGEAPPHKRLGKYVMYAKADVRDWLAKRRTDVSTRKQVETK
jgi:predicted DNA-binding transcriptional regulator AlpA